MTAVLTRGTLAAEVSLDADGVVCVRHRKGMTLTGAHMRETIAAVIDVCAGRRRPFLVDVRNVRAADWEARQVPASSEVVAVASRVALLVGNPVTRVIASFFVRIVAPRYPTCIFDDESAARAWLFEEGEPPCPTPL